MKRFHIPYGKKHQNPRFGNPKKVIQGDTRCVYLISGRVENLERRLPDRLLDKTTFVVRDILKRFCFKHFSLSISWLAKIHTVVGMQP